MNRTLDHGQAGNPMGARLRAARLAHNLSQDELAGAAMLGVATIKRAEAGASISSATLKSLCSVLELDANGLQADNLQAQSSPVAGHARGELEAIAPNLPSTPAMMASLGVVVVSLVCMVATALLHGYYSDNPLVEQATWWGYGLLVVSGAITGTTELACIRPDSLYDRGLYSVLTWATLALLAIQAGLVCTPGLGRQVVDTWPLASWGLVLGVLSTYAGILRQQILSRARRKSGLELESRAPAELAAMAELLAGPGLDDAARARVGRTALALCRLAISAGRAEDAIGLALMLEDLEHSVSGRADLARYIDVAGLLLTTRHPGIRARRDAEFATSVLSQRLAGLA